VPHCEYVTTTTHKTLRGPRGGLILCKAELAADLDRVMFPGIQGGPLVHIIAAKAVAFEEALQPAYKAYIDRVVDNAAELATAVGSRGFRIVSGGTDTHLFLVDVFSKGITGKAAEKALEQAGITVNKNTIPFDTNKPFVASGIRVGTPAVTTRGMGLPEMGVVADMICRGLEAREDPSSLARIREEVLALTARFPLYAKRLAASGARA
jgi:glycine hydroxymethyltransferase